jgi:hypothetical protein
VGAFCCAVALCFTADKPWILKFTAAVLTGLIWESFHYFKRPLVLRLLPNNVLHDEFGFSYPLAHAIWDAFIMLCIYHYFDAIFSHFVIIGVLQAAVVEFLCNGNVWLYDTSFAWNPVIFSHHNVAFTLLPVAEWMVLPSFVFYPIAHYIDKNAG